MVPAETFHRVLSFGAVAWVRQGVGSSFIRLSYSVEPVLTFRLQMGRSASAHMGRGLDVIQDSGAIIAIIIFADYEVQGITFVTPQEFSLQLGHMTRPKDYKVAPHAHNPVHRETLGTQEVLFIKKGRIRVDFYSYAQQYLESRELSAGDLILLAGAGHGIKVLEETMIVEVKNGPFIEGADKGRFEGRED